LGYSRKSPTSANSLFTHRIFTATRFAKEASRNSEFMLLIKWFSKPGCNKKKKDNKGKKRGISKKKMIKHLLNFLLSPSPSSDFTELEVIEYERMIPRLCKGEFAYDSTYPKYRFLQFLALKNHVLFHGSNNSEIDIFEPREQTLFNGDLVRAVFASADPTWSIFYAVFDRSKQVGSFRNGCLIFKNKKYHFYSLNASTMLNNPWTKGTIYILPQDKFKKSDNNIVHFDEWVSHEHVKPIARLEVGIEDFYFRDKVSTHKDNESLLKTWLLYKVRSKRAKPTMARNSR